MIFGVGDPKMSNGVGDPLRLGGVGDPPSIPTEGTEGGYINKQALACIFQQRPRLGVGEGIPHHPKDQPRTIYTELGTLLDMVPVLSMKWYN
jgi:hypothetical protein